MEKNTENSQQTPEIVLSSKEKVLEMVANAMCFLLLFASLMKVLFF